MASQSVTNFVKTVGLKVDSGKIPNFQKFPPLEGMDKTVEATQPQRTSVLDKVIFGANNSRNTEKWNLKNFVKKPRLAESASPIDGGQIINKICPGTEQRAKKAKKWDVKNFVKRTKMKQFLPRISRFKERAEGSRKKTRKWDLKHFVLKSRLTEPENREAPDPPSKPSTVKKRRRSDPRNLDKMSSSRRSNEMSGGPKIFDRLSAKPVVKLRPRDRISKQKLLKYTGMSYRKWNEYYKRSKNPDLADPKPLPRSARSPASALDGVLSEKDTKVTDRLPTSHYRITGNGKEVARTTQEENCIRKRKLAEEMTEKVNTPPLQKVRRKGTLQLFKTLFGDDSETDELAEQLSIHRRRASCVSCSSVITTIIDGSVIPYEPLQEHTSQAEINQPDTIAKSSSSQIILQKCNDNEQDSGEPTQNPPSTTVVLADEKESALCRLDFANVHPIDGEVSADSSLCRENVSNVKELCVITQSDELVADKNNNNNPAEITVDSPPYPRNTSEAPRSDKNTVQSVVATPPIKSLLEDVEDGFIVKFHDEYSNWTKADTGPYSHDDFMKNLKWLTKVFWNSKSALLSPLEMEKQMSQVPFHASICRHLSRIFSPLIKHARYPLFVLMYILRTYQIIFSVNFKLGTLLPERLYILKFCLLTSLRKSTFYDTTTASLKAILSSPSFVESGARIWRVLQVFHNGSGQNVTKEPPTKVVSPPTTVVDNILSSQNNPVSTPTLTLSSTSSSSDLMMRLATRGVSLAPVERLETNRRVENLPQLKDTQQRLESRGIVVKQVPTDRCVNTAVASCGGKENVPTIESSHRTYHSIITSVETPRRASLPAPNIQQDPKPLSPRTTLRLLLAKPSPASNSSNSVKFATAQQSTVQPPAIVQMLQHQQLQYPQLNHRNILPSNQEQFPYQTQPGIVSPVFNNQDTCLSAPSWNHFTNLKPVTSRGRIPSVRGPGGRSNSLDHMPSLAFKEFERPQAERNGVRGRGRGLGRGRGRGRGRGGGTQASFEAGAYLPFTESRPPSLVLRPTYAPPFHPVSTQNLESLQMAPPSTLFGEKHNSILSCRLNAAPVPEIPATARAQTSISSCDWRQTQAREPLQMAPRTVVLQPTHSSPVEVLPCHTLEQPQAAPSVQLHERQNPVSSVSCSSGPVQKQQPSGDTAKQSSASFRVDETHLSTDKDGRPFVFHIRSAGITLSSFGTVTDAASSHLSGSFCKTPAILPTSCSESSCVNAKPVTTPTAVAPSCRESSCVDATPVTTQIAVSNIGPTALPTPVVRRPRVKYTKCRPAHELRRNPSLGKFMRKPKPQRNPVDTSTQLQPSCTAVESDDDLHIDEDPPRATMETPSETSGPKESQKMPLSPQNNVLEILEKISDSNFNKDYVLDLLRKQCGSSGVTDFSSDPSRPEPESAISPREVMEDVTPEDVSVPHQAMPDEVTPEDVSDQAMPEDVPVNNVARHRLPASVEKPATVYRKRKESKKDEKKEYRVLIDPENQFKLILAPKNPNPTNDAARCASASPASSTASDPPYGPLDQFLDTRSDSEIQDTLMKLYLESDDCRDSDRSLDRKSLMKKTQGWCRNLPKEQLCVLLAATFEESSGSNDNDADRQRSPQEEESDQETCPPDKISTKEVDITRRPSTSATQLTPPPTPTMECSYSTCKTGIVGDSVSCEGCDKVFYCSATCRDEDYVKVHFEQCARDNLF